MRRSKHFDEFLYQIYDLLSSPLVLSMDEFEHHGATSCLDHSMGVAYASFLLAKRLGLNSRAAARGGLLHDFFLYDWRVKGSHTGLHAFTHPRAAMENAVRHFDVTPLEQEIILTHMFPLGMHLPRSRESIVVCLMDKVCAVSELTGLGILLGLNRRVSEILRRSWVQI